MTNILIIISDQLSAGALRAYGNTFAKTPNIDRLIDSGVRFENAYCNSPLCQPSRGSFWTSLYPHETGIDSNGRLVDVPIFSKDKPTLGTLFRDAGYKTVHFGKTHDAGTLHGFEVAKAERGEIEPWPAWSVNYDSEQDVDTRRKAVRFLSNYDGDQPFLAVADMNNPHNICGWIGDNQGVHEDVPVVELPELPDNLYVENFDELPKSIQYICCAHNRQAQISEWDEDNIRHYLRAYHHYMSLVDADIGKILGALESREDADDTLIVFMADHGDSMCGRWMATKHTSFYEETTHVPFAFAGPKVKGQGRAISGLTSLIDLVPTLCDYVGIDVPASARGTSLVPCLTGEANAAPNDYVMSQWYTEWGFTIEPGRMLRTKQYKYCRYAEEDGEELYDLETDPGEVRTLINDPAYVAVLKEHRELFKQAVAAVDDPFFSQEHKADERWRSHEPGYRNHRGLAAPADHDQRNA